MDPELFTEYRGERVFLCCRKCLKQFRADPAAYAGNLPVPVALAVAEKQGESDADHLHGEAGQEGEMDEHAVQDQHGSTEAHDHSDHGAGEESDSSSVIRWLGRLHPLVVHFPIALLLMAAAAEILLIITRSKRFAFAARFCLWGGALGALSAASLGWMDAISVQDTYVNFSAKLLLFHRWVGVGTALTAVLTLFACERSLRGGGESWRRSYRVLLILCAILVSVAGHLGASLIYGWEYLAW